MTRWHKSLGIFHSALLKDPSCPDNPPATKAAGKMEILIRNLPTNHTSVGDIPMYSPTLPRSSFPLP